MEPRKRYQGMNSASLCNLAGRYDNPIPPRFLAPIDSLKIPALLKLQAVKRPFELDFSKDVTHCNHGMLLCISLDINALLYTGPLHIFMHFIQHCFICRPSDSTLPKDAGNESNSQIHSPWLGK
jgi:hypothetical protein